MINASGLRRRGCPWQQHPLEGGKERVPTPVLPHPFSPNQAANGEIPPPAFQGPCPMASLWRREPGCLDLAWEGVAHFWMKLGLNREEKKSSEAGRGEAGPSRPKSEGLEQRIHHINNESLESTRRMLQLVDESKDAGIRTLVMLDDQGEQLDRIEDGLDQIIQDMKEAEKNLSDMAKCCGLFVCPCAKLKNMKAMEASKAASSNTQDVVSQQPIMMTAGTQMMMSGPFIQRVMKDDVEDEIEQNLIQVDSMLSNLRSMAVDMSNEIDVQSKQVENIKEKAVANVISISEANNQTTKMLKKA
ncbi:synaptosomal-associated protein 25-like [Crotalus adamanteus]|uniref:Synaptosomal-associated protein n=1 Tax=Crotalus adamanteus TaxID=8729 RepID=A0AAW1AX14_CROAD